MVRAPAPRNRQDEVSVRIVTEDEIDAGAKALRERMMGGKITRSWDRLPNSDKRKWREHAATVLAAAAKPSKDKGPTP
jgi:hypothetical protein